MHLTILPAACLALHFLSSGTLALPTSNSPMPPAEDAPLELSLSRGLDRAITLDDWDSESPIRSVAVQRRLGKVYDTINSAAWSKGSLSEDIATELHQKLLALRAVVQQQESDSPGLAALKTLFANLSEAELS
ncbi:MAG: hypothetical protein M1829_006148 [Trizodia sp. TS-e1964]|nr:MAG: hypothetical protein M1829_006148 [Trizodia sp. TS-e1964]